MPRLLRSCSCVPALSSPEPTQSRPPRYCQFSGQQQQQPPLTGQLDSAGMTFPAVLNLLSEPAFLALGHCLRSISSGWIRSSPTVLIRGMHYEREGPCFCKAQSSFLMDISSSPKEAFFSSLLCSLSDLGPYLIC